MSKCCENSIKEAAYYLWLNAGSPAGQDDYFWALAVKQCSNKNGKMSCTTSLKTSSKPTMKKVSASSNNSSKKSSTKKVTASTSSNSSNKAATTAKKF